MLYSLKSYKEARDMTAKGIKISPEGNITKIDKLENITIKLLDTAQISPLNMKENIILNMTTNIFGVTEIRRQQRFK
ncbi:MAG: hypothetical protein LBB59_03365 [Campylobacteraceae bacterium]|jgi:hypothetical protein|nr:hypothetical protein [Campylobacteraceae bacterium]